MLNTATEHLSSFPIATASKAGIQDAHLLDVARSLSKLDSAVIEICVALLRRVLETESHTMRDTDFEAVRQDLVFVEAIQLQFNSLWAKKARFRDEYLEDTGLVQFWQKAFALARQIMASRTNHDFTDYLGPVEDRATDLQRTLLNAASHNVLTLKMVFAIGERWMRLDEMLDFREEKRGTERSTELETWYV